MPQTSELQQSGRVQGQKHQSVPCIDTRQLGDPDADAISTIRNACLNPGFFYLDDTFDSEGSIGRVIGQMDAFFGLDDADPRKQAVNVGVTKSDQGWTPLTIPSGKSEDWELIKLTSPEYERLRARDNRNPQAKVGGGNA